MGKGITTVLGLAVGLVLFFGVNVLGNATLRGWRIDMTEEKLYTLSEGSKNIARSIDEPIRLKLFFSAEAASEDPLYKGYGQRVRELLEEYVYAADGGIELEIIDPEAYSDEEDEAVQAGLQAMRAGAYEQIFLGLVATNSVNDREVIPFFSPSRERFLEYEVTRLIYSLANPERRLVGVLTELPLDGGGFDPRTGRPLGPRWVIVDLVESLFDTRMLSPGLSEIPDDVDVLLVVHPEQLPDETRYAIDQFVLGGGEAVVMLDPHCEADQAADPSNPMMQTGGPQFSVLPDLLAAWGLEMVPNRVAADRENALTVRTREGGRVEEWPWVAWHAVNGERLNDEDPITSQLTQVHVPTPGILRPLPGATTTFVPLLRTGEDSMDLDAGSVQFNSSPQDILMSFVPRGESYTLAARVSGDARSAFPDGPPNRLDAPEPDGDGSEPPEGHLGASVEPINVIVFADCDFIADGFWLREDMFYGYVKMAENGDMLVNALENLSGGDDLISVRARGQFARPFDRVEAIAQAAREEYLAEERELQRKLDEAQQRVGEILQQTDPNAVMLPPELVEERRKWQETEQETKRQLREVKHSMLADVERLGFWVKAFNIAVMPLLVACAAIVVWFYRVQLRRS